MIYFTLKTLFLNCFFDFSVMQQKGRIRKIRLSPKPMTSQSVKQTIGIHILPNISISQ